MVAVPLYGENLSGQEVLRADTDDKQEDSQADWQQRYLKNPY